MSTPFCFPLDMACFDVGKYKWALVNLNKRGESVARPGEAESIQVWPKVSEWIRARMSEFEQTEGDEL